jgi:hypothetical protein
MANVSGAPFAQNTTGTPNPDDYHLGRGELFWAELSTSDVPDANGFVHLGNCPAMELVPTSEFFEHFSSMQGLKALDYKVLVQQKFDVKFTLEELSETIAALFFASTPAAYTNGAIAGFTAYAHTTAAKKGRWYPIQSSTGVRCYGIADTALTVTKTVGGTAMALNTDYQVDEEAGRIKFLSTGAVITDGDSVTIALAAAAGADATRQISVQSRSSSVTGALAFYGVNPKTGRKFELYIPKITIAADSAFALISQDLTNMPFTGSAERKDSSTYVATITALPAAP